MNALAHAIVDFGDLAVLLPLIVLMSVWLAALKRPRLLGWWAFAVVLCIGATAVSKVYLYVCPPLPDLRSPSGGASLSTLTYGALTIIAGSAVKQRYTLIVAIAGGAMIAAIILAIAFGEVHSIPEDALGTAIGLGTLWLFARTYLQEVRVAPRSALFMAAGCLVIVLALHGWDLSTEALLHTWASNHTKILRCAL